MHSEGELRPARTVLTLEDLLGLLDGLFEPDADRWTRRGADWWDRFYDQRDRSVPFFRAAPDESLVEWNACGQLQLPAGARVLELGCGPGRNAIWLAEQGHQVDALDLSREALRWAAERAEQAGVRVNFRNGSIFDWEMPQAPYDLVYDSGCFHHLPPHRRLSYRTLLERTVAPRGFFGLTCFAAGAMGSEESDADFYRTGRLSGGLAYSDEDLRAIFGWLETVEVRRMRESAADQALFGESFLWVGLFRRGVNPD